MCVNLSQQIKKNFSRNWPIAFAIKQLDKNANLKEQSTLLCYDSDKKIKVQSKYG